MRISVASTAQYFQEILLKKYLVTDKHNNCNSFWEQCMAKGKKMCKKIILLFYE